jgi:hypothetical protein
MLLSVSTEAGGRTSASTHDARINRTVHSVEPSIRLVYWEPEKARKPSSACYEAVLVS